MQQPSGKICTPVTLLTGFLGSGKTTLLRGLLRLEAMRNTAVVVNELGEIGLDHLLVESRNGDVVLMSGECLCCAVSDTLADTLADLASRRAAGELPFFDRVIIETTGLADPGPIVRGLEESRLIRCAYVLHGVVSTVDTLFGAGQIERHAEITKQIALADRILLTKTDLADQAEKARLVNRIRRINPIADIVPIVNGEIQSSAEFFNRPVAPLPELVPALEIDHRHHHLENHVHSDGVRALSLVIEHPVSWAGYAAWIDLLKQLPAQNLLRVKGILCIAENNRSVVIQGVQHFFSKPSSLRAAAGADGRSRVVVITIGLRAGTIEKTAEALKAPPGSQIRFTLRDVGIDPEDVIEATTALARE